MQPSWDRSKTVAGTPEGAVWFDSSGKSGRIMEEESLRLVQVKRKDKYERNTW
jgi:hypothetical protein